MKNYLNNLLLQIMMKKVLGTHFFNVNLLFLHPNIVPNTKIILIFSCGGGAGTDMVWPLLLAYIGSSLYKLVL